MNLAIPFVGTVGYVPNGELFPSFKRFGQHLVDHVVPHPRNNYHPHLLGHRAIALFSILLLSIKIASVALVTISPALPVDASAITTNTIFNLTNESRKQNNLGQLSLNSKLSSAASAKANDMLAKQYFAHNTPDGKTPWDFIKKTGYTYLIAGENLAVDFVEAESVNGAWMNSPGHRANILNADFEEIGIGIAQGEYQGHNSIFVVQMFGTQGEQPIKILATPTTVKEQQASPAPAPTQKLATTLVKPQTQIVLDQNTISKPSPVEANNIKPSSLLTDQVAPVNISVSGNSVELLLFAPEASKVMATYGGNRGTLFTPTADNFWKAILPLSETNGNVTVQVYNIEGILSSTKVATFSSSLENNYGVVPAVAGATANVFGAVFNIKQIENNLLLVFIALILLAMVIAIAIHRHVQHISLVANGAFVTIFATLLWYSGLG